MKVSKVEEQGLRLALRLARSGGRSTLNELAAAEGLSAALTAKILGRLRRGGVIRALRGRNGHYALSSPAEDTTVAQVIRAIDPAVVRGCFNDSDCVEQGASCPHGDDCSLRAVWQHIEQQVEAVLGQITVADLLKREGHVAEHVAQIVVERAVPRPAQSEVTAADRLEGAERKAQGGQ